MESRSLALLKAICETPILDTRTMGISKSDLPFPFEDMEWTPLRSRCGPFIQGVVKDDD